MSVKVDHPNAKTVWTTIDFSNGGMSTVVVVETDLALNVGDPKYDEKSIQELWEAAATQITDQHYAADVIRLVEIGRDA